jgi:hypothetical protein
MIRDVNVMSAREAGEWLVDILSSRDPLRHDELMRFQDDHPDWLDRYSEDEQYDLRMILGDIASYWMVERNS